MRILNAISAAGLYLCAATTVAQGIGLYVLWDRGMLTPDKVTRYAAILYGFDARTLAPAEGRQLPQVAESDSATTTLLAQRVDRHPLVVDRLAAIKSETGGIQDWTDNLRKNRERYEFVKSSFEDLLDQLERDASKASLQEVQRTLEVLQPKQAKDLLLGMLDDEPLDSEDDVLGDLVAIIRSMPQDKLKKILGEFKTDAEKKTLHRILVQIGQIDPRQQPEASS